MSLGWKAVLVFFLMVASGVLGIIAHRRNFDRVRRHYTSRRSRVPVQPPANEGTSAPPAGPEEPPPGG